MTTVFIVVERIVHWYEEIARDPSEEIIKVFANRADAEAFAAEQHKETNLDSYSYSIFEKEVF
jgi:hypothetical protein